MAEPDRRSTVSDGLRGMAAAVAGLLVLLALGAVGVAQSPEPTAGDADMPRRVVIRFLTDNDFPPFNFHDEDNTLTGFNVDLAQAICLELGAVCDVQERAWPELLSALGKGQADAVIAGHTVNPVSIGQADFTDSYMFTPGRFASKRGDVQASAAIGPSQLAGKRVGVARKTAHEAYLRTFFLDSRIVPFETAELARDALLTGGVDLIFDDGIGLSLWLNGTLSRQCCEFVGGPFFEARFFGEGIAIAIAKGDRQLKSLLNRALRQVQASGRLEELLAKYFPTRPY